MHIDFLKPHVVAIKSANNWFDIIKELFMEFLIGLKIQRHLMGENLELKEKHQIDANSSLVDCGHWYL